MDTTKGIEEWFRQNCNGEWENERGISIQTTDNPGWWVKVDLAGTALETKPFTTVAWGEPDEPTWLDCFVEDGVFNGAGDPARLGQILETFLRWVTEG